MNHVLKVVFSRAKGMYVVVSELGRACTKGSLKSVLIATPMVLASASVLAQGELVKNDASDDTKGTGIAIGLVGTADKEASATTESSIAIGVATSSSNRGSIAIGSSYYYVDPESSQVLTQSAATSSGVHSIAIGSGATASGNNAFAIGAKSTASGTASIALGLNTTSSYTSSIALGNSSQALNEMTIALGYSSFNTGVASVALGALTQAYGNYSVALGTLSVVQQQDILDGDVYGVISVGNSNTINGITPFNRRIINVADGLKDHDAVTVGQTKAALGDILGSGFTVDLNEDGDWIVSTDDGSGGTVPTTISEAIAAASGGVDWSEVASNNEAVAAIQAQAKNAMPYIAFGPKTDSDTVNNASAAGSYAVALGDKSVASGGESLAFGRGANTETGTWYGIAIGKDATSYGTNSIAIGGMDNSGNKNIASGKGSIALGAGSRVTAGWDSIERVNYGTALGYQAKVYAESSVAVGNNAQVATNGLNSVSLGYYANVEAENSVALGSYSNTNEPEVISVGGWKFDEGKNLYRRIINVAAGKADNDVDWNLEGRTASITKNGDLQSSKISVI